MTHLPTPRKAVFLDFCLKGEFRKTAIKTNRETNMRRYLLFFIASGILSLIFCGSVYAQKETTLVRLALLRIDSTQLESYKSALKEEIETSVRVEPGVLSLYAVSDKNHPDRITIFEIYASVEAYNAHRETQHFKKYKNVTREMVKSLELIEADPILLGSRK